MTYWETVIQNAIGCTLVSFLAITASYWIYYLSTKRTRKDQQLEKSQNEREAYDLIVLLVQNVNRSSEHWIKNIRDFSQDLMKSSVDFFELKYIPLNNFKRLSELQDLQRFLFAFTKLYPKKDTAVKDFANILAKVDYLQAQFIAISQQVKKGRYFNHQRKVQLKGLIEQSVDTLRNIFLSLPASDPIVVEFKPIINQYCQQRQLKSPLSYHILQFIQPINDAIVSMQKRAVLNNNLLTVKSLTGQALNIFNEIPEQKKVLSDDITKTLESIQRVFQELKKLENKMAL